jgi:hypothetical protein
MKFLSILTLLVLASMPWSVGAVLPRSVPGRVNPESEFDFALSNSGSIAVTQGGSGFNNVTVTFLNGTSKMVTLCASGLPSGASSSFSLDSWIPTFSAIFTVSTSPSTPPGFYTITVTGMGGGRVHTSYFILTVRSSSLDFGLGYAPDVTIVRGGSASNNIMVYLVSGSSGTVRLRCYGLPSGSYASLNPSAGTSSFVSNLTITTSASTPTGSFRLVITGTSGSLSRSISFNLNVIA